jgi:ABC-type transport system substrate-binding protein
MAPYALLLCGLAGCSAQPRDPQPFAQSPESAPRRGGYLEMASASDVRSLDPASIGDGIAPPLIALMFAGLLDYDANGKLAPDLAESYTALPDGPGYRFTLRQGARFHDGAEVTAAEVKRSMERALAPKTPNPSQALYASIAGFADFSTGKAEHLSGVRERGRYVLDIELTAPDATFLAVLALASIRPVCPSMGTHYAASATPCGAGPFRFGGWEHGQRITLMRFDAYFKPGLPLLDGVHLNLGSSYVTQKLKFEDGNQDVVREFLQPDLLRYLRTPVWQQLGTFEPEKQMAGEGMNVEVPPFDNVEIRRAVASAINREEYRLIKPSVLRPLTGPIPQGVQGYDPDLPCQRFDLTQALDHMRRAGYPYDPATGKGGYPHTIVYHTYAQALPEFTAQLLAQQLAKIGLRIEIRLMTYATWLAVSHRRFSSPFSYQGWSMDYSDPNDFLEPLFHSSAINDDDSNNSSFYRNADVDKWIDSAHGELNPTTRTALLRQATLRICEDAPWAFTYSVRFYTLRQPYVRGYRNHAVWSYDLREVWLDKPRPQQTSHAALLAPARVLPREQF